MRKNHLCLKKLYCATYEFMFVLVLFKKKRKFTGCFFLLIGLRWQKEQEVKFQLKRSSRPPPVEIPKRHQNYVEGSFIALFSFFLRLIFLYFTVLSLKLLAFIDIISCTIPLVSLFSWSLASNLKQACCIPSSSEQRTNFEANCCCCEEE